MWNPNDHAFHLKFVKEVEKHQVVYNYKHPGYTKRDEVLKAWQEIADKMKMQPAECRDRWRNLRLVFVRNVKRLQSGPQKRRPYYLQNALQFLIPFLKPTGSLDTRDWDITNIRTEVQDEDSEIEDSAQLEEASPSSITARHQPSPSTNTRQQTTSKATFSTTDHSSDSRNFLGNFDFSDIKTEVQVEDSQTEDSAHSEIEDDGEEESPFPTTGRQSSTNIKQQTTSPTTSRMTFPSTSFNDPIEPLTLVSRSVQKRTKNSTSSVADMCVAEYFEAERAKLQSNAGVVPDFHRIERQQGLRMFLLSLLPELEELSDAQIKLFKRKVLRVIDEIADSS
ncbi:uncharacterized protein LOC111057791 [Nilaparvata lugens]|uniref:uncharacterized protein LOC111057791 n=1 Tax=Nilaparvata lugens TaxID=108931 RepID=UPI00193D46B1|nr:uncharacterized protein LOC111057791 [Nilaparvata lugens]